MTNNKQQTEVGLLIEQAQEWGEYKKTMSNKLYTEEQLVNTIDAIRDYLKNYPEKFHESMIEKHLKNLTPIEPPNHHEIWEEAIKEESNQRRYDFMRGADWMRDKIQGGNNEQQ